MMVAVLCNAPKESLNSMDSAICAIIPAWTAEEVSLTNAPLVGQVRKISTCSFSPFSLPPNFLSALLSGLVAKVNKISSAFATGLCHNL